jgi:hypothetical protein
MRRLKNRIQLHASSEQNWGSRHVFDDSSDRDGDDCANIEEYLNSLASRPPQDS